LSERTHDVIPDTDLRYLRADCRHNPGDLMTEHRRRRNEIVSGEEQICMTQPGSLYVYENFAPNGLSDLHILKIKPTTDSVEHKRLHERSPYNRFEPMMPEK
jgi:hypothetical protein